MCYYQFCCVCGRRRGVVVLSKSGEKNMVGFGLSVIYIYSLREIAVSGDG